MVGSVSAAAFVPDPGVLTNGWGLNLAQEFNVISFALLDLNPASRGYINITCSNPETTPDIQFNPLARETDLEFMVDSYIDAFNIIVEARKRDPEGMYKVVYPPEDIFELPVEEKREMLRTFVRASYNKFSHYGGNCRMDTNIKNGVVDGFLNVFGTKNLK